ncbi:MAG TPA: response regulator [Treponemataceae bacterium]|nr:response regulator [Treponemataceae bacterium]
MKALIVEDDFTSRLLLQGILQPFGECHICVNGREAVDAFRAAIDANEPYTLVCLDIMMPEMDGQAALREFRSIEASAGIYASDGVKVIMTTALDDKKNIMNAFKEQCDIYLVKPIEREKLLESLRTLNMIT